MKLNKIIAAILCVGTLSFSAYSISATTNDQTEEFSNMVSSSNAEQVKSIIANKYPIIEKFNPNFKVAYLQVANIYEIDLGDQKAYTDSNVSYLYLRGQVFVNQDGKMLNLTLNPKDYIKNQIKSPTSNEEQDSNIQGSKSNNPVNNGVKVSENQKTHDTLQNDLYLKSLSQSSDITALKTSAMLEYVGDDGYSPLPKNSVDYIKDIDLTNAIKLVYGNGKRVMIMFADPDCPYCQHFEHTMTENANKIDVTVYVLPWALDIHKNAPEKVKFIWSQKDPSVAWKSWMTFAYLNPDLVKNDTAWQTWIEKTGRKMGEVSNAPTKIAEDFVEKYGLRYTPTVVYPNGAASEGDIDIDKLLSFLSVSENEVKK